MDPAKRIEYENLARDIMEPVLQVAGRVLEQSVQEIHKSKIAPLRTALIECLTVTPSLLTGEQAIERLKQINCHVYDVLHESV